MIFAAASQVYIFFNFYFKLTSCVFCHKQNVADTVEKVEHPQSSLFMYHESDKMSFFYLIIFLLKDCSSESSFSNLPPGYKTTRF